MKDCSHGANEWGFGGKQARFQIVKQCNTCKRNIIITRKKKKRKPSKETGALHH